MTPYALYMIDKFCENPAVCTRGIEATLKIVRACFLKLLVITYQNTRC